MAAWLESSLFQNSVLEFPVGNNRNHENLIPKWESDMFLHCIKIAYMQCENAC